MVRERDIEVYLVNSVRHLGGEVRKVQWVKRRGAPDRVVMLNGTWWVELKRPGKDATPAQAREHARMRKMGQRVLVINSFEQVDELCAQIG